MHRWTTKTYMGLCSVPEDQPHLQDYLPRAALKASYLMNGLLALSALELSRSSGKPATYLPAALEYSNKASADFRSQLCNITQENLHLLYYFSSIAAAFNFALPVEQMSPIERMMIAFDMVLGGFTLAMINYQWLVDSPTSLKALLDYGKVTLDILDSDTKIALDRLTSVSRQMTPKSIQSETQDTGQEDHADSEVYIYRVAISQLKYCFAEDARDRIKGYCLTLTPVAGAEFISAIRSMEPVALFILMYFGVLLHRYGADPMVWWVSTMGRDLVEEISGILLGSPLAHLEDGREGIAWTRQQVGLPPLEFGIDGFVDPRLLLS
jgi:hypothetical protein